MRPLFLPTARQTNWLLIIAFLSVGQAMYLRYMAIENLNVELACQAGLKTWLCGAFHVSTALYNHNGSGGVALAAARPGRIRPSIVLVAVALATGAFALVLDNTELAARAAALLIFSLARPAATTE